MRNGFRRVIGVSILCTLLIGFGLLILPAERVDAATVDPISIEGNATCGSLDPTWVEFHKVEPVTDGGVWPAADADMHVTWDAYATSGGQALDWTSSFPILGVFVKGGPGGNLYRYEAGSSGDTLLHAPANSSGGWPALSHISFCHLETTTTSSPTTTPTTPPTEPTTPTTVTLAGEIGDYVWHDVDANGIQGIGEEGLGGVAVKLLKGGSVVANTRTDALGKYLFAGLVAGIYEVQFALPDGYQFSAPDQTNDAEDSDALAGGKTGPIALAAGEKDHTWDAGIFRPAQVLPQVVTTSTAVETLPFTGSPNSPGLAGLASSLVALGGMALISMKRRADQPAAGWSRRLPEVG
jgi:hypothetical protein